MTWQVIVGNIGTVYDGDDAKSAMRTYLEYIDQSKLVYGRASGENVVLLNGGDVLDSYDPTSLQDILDNWIHDYFEKQASEASSLNTQGQEAQVAFILEHGGFDDLVDAGIPEQLLRPPAQPVEDYYFLCAGWEHCFTGSIPTGLYWCLAVRKDDENATLQMVGALRQSGLGSLNESEKADLMQSFAENPEWFESPHDHGIARHDQVQDVPDEWYPAITEFLRRPQPQIESTPPDGPYEILAQMGPSAAAEALEAYVRNQQSDDALLDFLGEYV